ncbi:MAG: 3-phosphoglycerate dehydrogenase [Calditrichaeota bacterium]|nr:MAG: 3-phosphoglycerate dehydrogenase [Calditrichota bacterium]
MKVLISDKTSPVCAEILRQAGHDVGERSGISPEELKEIIRYYDGLIVRSATKVTADIIAVADRLKVIGRAGSGVDNIDVAAASERNIVVMNTPGGNTNAVAELALGHMLMLSRDLYTAVDSLKNERWEKKKFHGREIIGKTVGLLGYGRVSRTLGKKCLALDMRVLCYDPKIRKNLVDADGIELTASPEALFAHSDYLSVHLTKKPETLNFVARPQFEQMKKGVFFINCSRGGIVNEKDLLWALEEGIVAGAALDVYETEPPTDFELIHHPKVVCTPHIGAATHEAQENVARAIAEQFVDFFAGKGARNRVN